MPSEFSLIAQHFTRPTRHTELGVGDDAAIIRPTPGMELLISTDMLVAGTHFFTDTEPTALGWKTLAVNVSDMAAMGARPRWAVLAAALPHCQDAWLAAFAEGLFHCAQCFGIDLIGGDTTRGPLNFCLTIFGEAPTGRALRRSTAKAGDDIWISGTPGRAALGLAHLQGRCTLEPSTRALCLDALNHPEPRLKLGLALMEHQLANAAIDVSDGLLADLGHILAASDLKASLEYTQLLKLPTLPQPAEIDAKLWQECLLAGGDDYELIFTASPEQRAQISALASAEVPLQRIGQTHTAPSNIATHQRIQVLDAHGQTMPVSRHGYDHFV